VLDVFANGGAFAVAALVGGARAARAIESSSASLAALERHLASNGLAPGAVEASVGDAFAALRAEGASWDLVVLDPPPFAKRKGEVEGACRGYKEINLQALRRLAPDGLLVTSSCSQHVDPWLFQQLLFQAARDAGRTVQLLARLGQPPDHPVALDHPEGEYLKVFLLRVVG
jgi:23S rRNA (cytosine1962-C5)-methyltransferase